MTDVETVSRILHTNLAARGPRLPLWILIVAVLGLIVAVGFMMGADV